MNLKVPGATIHYEVSGSGPLLLMIPGAPGDAGGFATLANFLNDRYTVVRYDLRATSRSPLSATSPSGDSSVPASPSGDEPAIPSAPTVGESSLPATPSGDEQVVSAASSGDGGTGSEASESGELAVETHVDDAHRLLLALAESGIGHGEGAYVLGCSGGGMIALDLLAHHPEQVRGLVAHEPPMMSLLPDAAKWRAAFEDVYQTYLREGAGVGMGRFIGVAMSTDPEADQPAGPPPMPDMSQLPPEALESIARLQANSDVFLGRMLRTSFTHEPDLPALRAAAKPITIAVGEASKGQMPHEVGVALADRLGIVALTVPGDHTGFSTYPAEFAEAVHAAFYGYL